MSEYRVVAYATISPTRCFFCLDYKGPFIDTHVEDPAFGHIYICGPDDDRPGCIGQMAALFGLTKPDELVGELAETKEKVAELEKSQTVTLTYDDLLKAMTATKRANRTLSGKKEE
jgi:hypothetical protein